MTVSMTGFLRIVLLADAAASALTAILLMAAAAPLQGWLGLPVALMQGAGLMLSPYVAFVAAAAFRTAVSVKIVEAIIACNALWVAGSFGILASGWISPSLLGASFVIAQAVAVGLFGILQYVVLRQQARAAG